ncbi:hemolysin-III channel protein Izh2 [Penicillium longicatenatum]|nr:hemolysin-III channel protein Izh2 [Penicillium longicatenatum]
MLPSPRQRKQPSPHITPAKSQSPSLQLNLTPAQRLLSYNDVPEWYSDNPYILTGYRPISNSTQTCLSSLFYLHNESINIYSHLIPAVAFLLAEWTLYHYLQMWYPHTPLQDQIILAFFLLTATICLGMSATFHTLMNHSEDVCNLWLQLDFIGIVILILGDYVSGINMVFYCEHDLKCIYWGMIGTLSVVCLIILVNPRFQGLRWRTFRLETFVTMGLFGVAPFFHGIARFGFMQMMKQSGAPFFIAEELLLALGAVVYIVSSHINCGIEENSLMNQWIQTRVPESLDPGKFDIFGSSHQIFHVLVVLATTLHLVGVLSAFDYNYHNRSMV